MKKFTNFNLLASVLTKAGMYKGFFIAFVIVFMAFFNSYAQTTVTLYPIGDAFIQEADPNTNMGSSDYLYVGDNPSGDEIRTLIKWDLSSLPSCINIDNAYIELYKYLNPSDYSGGVKFYRIMDPWNEMSVTWNNQPLGVSYIDVFYVSPETGTISHSATVLVNLWLNYGNNGVRYNRNVSGTKTHDFYSSSGSVSPKLTITYTNATPPTASISGNTNICQGVSTTLTASGGTSYLWDTGVTTSSITVSPSTSTQYCVTVTDANGCTDQTCVTVTVKHIPPAPTGVSASDGTYCNEAHISWNSASGADCYKIIRGSTTLETCYSGTSYIDDSGAPTSSTTYKVYSKNDCGYSSSYDSDNGYAKTLPPAPTGVSASDGTYCDEVHISWNSASGTDCYKIMRGSTTLETCYSGTSYIDNSSAPTSSTTYKVYSKNDCGYSSSYDSDNGYADDCSAIDEILSKYITKIYPNPTFDKLNIEFTDNINKIEKLTLSNMLGQVVYTIKGKKINTRNFVIDLSEYKSGVYYLNVQTKEDGTMRNKISVVK